MAKNWADDIDERVALIDEAQDLVAQAVQLLQAAVSDSPIQGNVGAYLQATLEVAVGAGGWMSRDQTFETVKADLRNEATSQDDDEGDVFEAYAMKMGG